MRRLVLMLALWPSVVAAEEPWRGLTGPEITTALSERVLQYADGTRQDFMADGRTLYGEESWGSWRVEGDEYCSVWPPSDRWACYSVEIRGLELRFTDGGEPSVGRYVDLN
ncbi:hypothetical protein [Tabrizicola sp.]|uniref:hypothetical protein n=1 Tax=Tabrizicola sp. TaxID=2005166 RepID=UPI00286CBF54|nr:hypothetical protein [Tabrizicola sp.]